MNYKQTVQSLATSSLLITTSWFGVLDIKPALAHEECGTATYYDTGEITSSGAAFDPGAYTAASSYIPNGTYVVVRNIDTGLEVTVEINDYNPGNGIIDVTPAVMEALDPAGDNLSLDVCLYY
jgi:rare lipoprotein A (peptidoglycan hydrolase)